MKDHLDAGHKHLFEAGCSGLSGAWRRAAESSVEHFHAPAAAPQPRQRHNRRVLLAVAAVTLVAGLCFIAESAKAPVDQPFVDATVTAPPGGGAEPKAEQIVGDSVLARIP